MYCVSLLLKAVAAEDAGTYRVEVWSGSQPSRVQSRGAEVTVTGVGMTEEVRKILEEHADELSNDRPSMTVVDFAGQDMYSSLQNLLLTRMR